MCLIWEKNKMKIILTILFISAGLILAFLLILFIRRIIAHFSKDVPKPIDKSVKKDNLRFKTEKKRAIVLFSDIKRFTNYAEKNEPELVVKNLNKILRVQANIVEEYNGDINKFIGNEIMAIFEDEYQAVKCGYEIIKNVYLNNKKENIDLYISIGINTGEVIAGNIGTKNKLEYTVIGKVVNLASKLCDIAEPNMMLISESTYKKVNRKVKVKLISNQKTKSKTGIANFYVVQSIK